MFEIIYPNYFKNLMTQRPHHLLREFSRQGYKSIFYNINAQNREIIMDGENFYIYNKQFPHLKKEGKRILWISYPPLFKEVGKYDEDMVVFDCIDYPEDKFEYWKKGLDRLRDRADFIFATSQKLIDYNKNYSSKTYICRNGADFEHFNRACGGQLEKPMHMKYIKGPILGYIGAVAQWIDWRLIEYLANKKEFSIVFVGPLFKMLKSPINSENVYFLGEKEYEELPNYLQCFNTCMIPFEKGSITEACNPVKMYEYLSAGKPIVSTDLPECRIECVENAKDYEEFYKKVMKSLKNENSEFIKKRLEFARENSWENRVRFIRTIIEGKLID